MASPHDEFTRFFNEFYPSLCRFLECLLGGRGGSATAAQDIAQETFLQLHRTGFDNLPRDEARFWLFRVGRNLALNELSRRQTRHRLFDQVVNVFRAHVPGPEEDSRWREQRARLEMLDTCGAPPRPVVEGAGESYREREVLGARRRRQG